MKNHALIFSVALSVLAALSVGATLPYSEEDGFVFAHAASLPYCKIGEI